MGARHWLTVLAALAGGTLPANAADVRSFEVIQKEKGYAVAFEAVVAIAPDRAFAVLTDYDRLTRLNPGIKESERVASEDGRVRVRTVVEGCVAFFCRSLERLQEVETADSRRIETRMIPEGSDFKAGTGRWELAAVAQGTRMTFRAHMVPDFWIPPVIGPWATERNLRDNMRVLFKRMEALPPPGEAEEEAAGGQTASEPDEAV